MKKPRQYSFVKFDWDAMDKTKEGAEYWKKQYPKEFSSQGYSLIFFGEIPNMPEHCIIMSHTRKGKDKFHVGHHVWNFIELTEEET